MNMLESDHAHQAMRPSLAARTSLVLSGGLYVGD